MPAEPTLHRPKARVEKWISSAVLAEMPENTNTSPARPMTPESKPFIPALSLSTPSGRSPLSLGSSSVHESPPGLTPLQFLRRADVDPVLPVTPSKAGPRPRLITPQGPSLAPAAATNAQLPVLPSAPQTPARGLWRP